MIINREFLKVAVLSTYLEIVGNRSDSMHLAMEHYSEKDTVRGIGDSIFSRIFSL